MSSVIKLFVVVLLPVGLFANNCQIIQKKYIQCLIIQDKTQKCKPLKTQYAKCSENKLTNSQTTANKTKPTNTEVWIPPSPSTRSKIPKSNLSLNPRQIQIEHTAKQKQDIQTSRPKKLQKQEKSVLKQHNSSKSKLSKTKKRKPKTKKRKGLKPNKTTIWIAKPKKPRKINTKKPSAKAKKIKKPPTIQPVIVHSKPTKVISKNRQKTTQRPKQNSHELYIAGGFSYFEIQNIAGYELNQAVASLGGSVGLNFSLSKILNTKTVRGLYISAYVSRYSGAKYILENNVWLQNTVISSYGINIEARYKFTKKEKIYFAPFVGLKHKKIETKAGPTYKYDYYQSGITVPLGINLGVDISNSFNIFAQISIDAIYLNGEKRYGEWEADPTTRTGPGGLVGFAYKF